MPVSGSNILFHGRYQQSRTSINQPWWSGVCRIAEHKIVECLWSNDVKQRSGLRNGKRMICDVKTDPFVKQRKIETFCDYWFSASIANNNKKLKTESNFKNHSLPNGRCNKGNLIFFLKYQLDRTPESECVVCCTAHVCMCLKLLKFNNRLWL